MIFRKPYAFFIRIFKPIHLIMYFLMLFLIYKTNNILNFFNQYMHSTESVVGNLLKEKYVTLDLYIIPICIIVFSLIFLGIMFKKKKPYIFYVTLIFSFLVIIVITLYAGNVLKVMEGTILSIKIIKLIHDLILINMILEIVLFILLIIRGLGINFKKFNFDSDISKFNISDSDKEEFELSINIDVDESKRKRKKRWRELKYLYKENKLVFNISIFAFVIGLGVVSCLLFFKQSDYYKEGIFYDIGNFKLMINNSFILNENFEGKKITENNLIIVNTSLQSSAQGVSLFEKDFSLEIGDAIFYPETKFKSELIDLGVVYNKNILTNESEEFLFIYEIPEKYINSDIFLAINNNGNKTKMKLNPKNYVSTDVVSKKNLGDVLEFENQLKGVSFEIRSIEIKEKFILKYNFCLNNNECLLSSEYIKPTIDENFDKVVLKLNVKYKNDSNLNVNSFFEFFSKFASIQYKIGDKLISQKGNFEEIKSKKVNVRDDVYIGVNSSILNSESIKIVFFVRGSSYEYILK